MSAIQSVNLFSVISTVNIQAGGTLAGCLNIQPFNQPKMSQPKCPANLSSEMSVMTIHSFIDILNLIFKYKSQQWKEEGNHSIDLKAVFYLFWYPISVPGGLIRFHHKPTASEGGGGHSRYRPRGSRFPTFIWLQPFRESIHSIPFIVLKLFLDIQWWYSIDYRCCHSLSILSFISDISFIIQSICIQKMANLIFKYSPFIYSTFK